MIRTIACLLTAGDGTATPDLTALDASLELARREGAHLDVTAFGIETTVVEVMPMGASVALIEGARREAEAQAEGLVRAAHARLGGEPRVSIESQVVPLGALGLTATRIGRISDIAVASAPMGEIGRAVFDALVIEAGVPVLVMPQGAALPEFRRVVLAWDDSNPALSAARAALPLLARADQVDVVVIDPPAHAPDRSDPGGAVSLWLARHGIRAEVAVLSKSLPRVADVLSRAVADRGADALVMGAWGHSRLREAILGGTTRDLLSAAPVPMLMAN